MPSPIRAGPEMAPQSVGRICYSMAVHCLEESATSDFAVDNALRLQQPDKNNKDSKNNDDSDDSDDSDDITAIMRALSVSSPRLRVADVLERRRLLDSYRTLLDRVMNDRGIAQRTEDWYKARGTMITASDFAQAVGQAKFGTEREFYEKKCGYVPATFDSSIPPLRWGIMFEEVACRLYSHLNNDVEVHEFGLIRHPDKPFLGASPDGITADGVMLEIKCPWRRKINGEVPVQYYYQIQGQLAVCGLRECDFFECEIDHIADADEEFERLTAIYHAADMAFVRRSMGVIIECIHRRTGERTYLYPPRETGASASTVRELKQALDAWVIGENAAIDGNDHNAIPVWWKLRKYGLVKVRIDDDFVDALVQDLEQVWKRVETFKGDRQAYDAYIRAATGSRRARSSVQASEGAAVPAYVKVATESKPYVWLDEESD